MNKQQDGDTGQVKCTCKCERETPYPESLRLTR